MRLLALVILLSHIASAYLISYLCRGLAIDSLCWIENSAHPGVVSDTQTRQCFDKLPLCVESRECRDLPSPISRLDALRFGDSITCTIYHDVDCQGLKRTTDGTEMAIAGIPSMWYEYRSFECWKKGYRVWREVVGAWSAG